MTAPTFAPVDEDTADLLDLIAADADRLPWSEREWASFKEGLETAAIVSARFPLISQTVLRNHCRLFITPHNVGPFTKRALREGLIEWTGDWEPSTDTKGRNSGKPVRIYRWRGSN